MKLNKWFYLTALSFIWGSSFILIKKGLVGLTAIELGSIRIIISALVLIPFTINRLKEISHKQWKWIKNNLCHIEVQPFAKSIQYH